MLRPFLKALGAAALAFAPLHASLAQQGSAFVVPYSGTLKTINDSGVLRIGHRESSPPFAFLALNLPMSSHLEALFISSNRAPEAAPVNRP